MLFADTLGISKREFYTIIGVSRGTLESKTGITEDVMAKFIAAYPDVSIEWLVVGNGEIFKHGVSPQSKNTEKNSSQHEMLSQFITALADKDNAIREQAEEIGRLREQVRQLNQERKKDVSDASTSGIANVG